MSAAQAMTGQEFLSELNRRITAYIVDHDARDHDHHDDVAQKAHCDGLINGAIDAFVIAEQIITGHIGHGVVDVAMAKYGAQRTDVR